MEKKEDSLVLDKADNEEIEVIIEDNDYWPAKIVSTWFHTDILFEYQEAMVNINSIDKSNDFLVKKVKIGEKKYVLKSLSLDNSREELLDKEFSTKKRLSEMFPYFAKPVAKKTATNNAIFYVEMLIENEHNSLEKILHLSNEKVLMCMIQSVAVIMFNKNMKAPRLNISPNHMFWEAGKFKFEDIGSFIINDLKRAEEKSNGLPHGGLYLPPEELRDIKNMSRMPNEKADVYCWGMAFYQLITKKNSNDMLALRKYHLDITGEEYKEFHIKIMKEQELLHFDPTERVANIIFKCLNYRPETRPSFEEICQDLSLIEGIKDADAGKIAQEYEICGNAFREYACNYEIAQAYHEKALRIRELVFGSEDISVAKSLYEIGINKLNRGKHVDALKDFERCLKFNFSKEEKKQQIKAALLLAKGSAMRCLENNFDEASKTMTEALKLAKSSFGPDHISLIDYYGCLGSLYFDNQYYDGSQGYFNDALKISKKHNINCGIRFAHINHNLGIANFIIGDDNLALDCYKAALDDKLKLLGEEHVDTAWSLVGIATVYQEKKEYSEAIHHYRRAYEIFKKTLGEEHDETKRCRINLDKLK